MVSVVAARQYFKEPDEKAPDQAILVVPGGVAGAATVANLLVRRLDKLSRYLEGEVEKREREQRRSRAYAAPTSGGGGGGSLLGSVLGGAAGGATAGLARRMLGPASRMLLRGAPVIGGAIGAAGIYNDISKGKKVSLIDAALTGAATGAGAGALFGGVGAVPGAVLGAVTAVGAAALYNARDAIAETAKNAVGWMSQTADSAYNSITSMLSSAVDNAKRYGSDAVAYISSAWSYISTKFLEMRNSASTWFDAQTERLKSWLSFLGEKIAAGIAVVADPVEFAKRWLSKIGASMSLPTAAPGDTGAGISPKWARFGASRNGAGGGGGGGGGASTADRGAASRGASPQFGGDYSTGGGFDPATGTTRFGQTPQTYSPGSRSRSAPSSPGAGATPSMGGSQGIPAYNQFRPMQEGGGRAVTDARGRVISTADTNMAPHQRALLDTIAMGNATSGGRYWESPDYNTVVGGSKFESFDQHPNRVGIRTQYGPSTAAGRYQFTATTWRQVVDKYNAANPNNPIRDFRPESQDRAAWWLAKDDYRRRTGGRDLDSDLQSGDPRVGDWIKRGLGGSGDQTTWQIFQKKSGDDIRQAYQSNLERNQQYQRDAETSRNASVTNVTPTLREGTAVDPSMFDPNPTAPPNLGRRDGASASPATGPSAVNERQRSAAQIRTGDLDPKLKTQLEYAASVAGVEVDVTSGGQPSAGRYGVDRTGSTRHDHGRAADFDLYVRDADGRRRKLDARNPEDRAVMERFVEAGSRAGMTGWGHGAGYMGHSKIHGGGGTEATWGASGAEGGWLWGAAERGRPQRRDFDVSRWARERDAAAASRVRNVPTSEQVAEAGARGEAIGDPSGRGLFSYAPNLRDAAQARAQASPGTPGGPQAIPEGIGPSFGSGTGIQATPMQFASPSMGEAVDSAVPEVEQTPEAAVPETLEPTPAQDAPDPSSSPTAGVQSGPTGRASLDQIPVFNPDVNLSVMAMSDES